MNPSDELFERISDLLARRAEDVSGDPKQGNFVREMIRARRDQWSVFEGRPGAPLAYRQVPGADAIPLLQQPTAGEWTIWTCPTSMREVEPDVNFVMDVRDPSVDNPPLFDRLAGDGQGVQLPLADEVEDEVPEDERV